MSVVAILGAGPLGAAIAHKLAERERFQDIRLIDEQAAVASGKALDLRQTGPIGGFDTRLEGRADLLDAAGADVVVVADPVGSGEWQGEPGLAMVRRLVEAGVSAPLVFAGPGQSWLMERVVVELGVPAERLVATAGSALVGGARALVGIELGGSGTDVELVVAGRPPAFVIGWSSATAGGALVSARIPAHRLLSIADTLRRLWPPGPQAIGAATARVAEGLAFGSRRLHQAATVLDGELGIRGVAGMLPIEVARGRILARHVPALSPQEMTALQSSLAERAP